MKKKRAGSATIKSFWKIGFDIVIRPFFPVIRRWNRFLTVQLRWPMAAIN